MISWPMTIQGTEYASARAVAEAFGVAPSSVRKMISRGRAHCIGQKPHHTRLLSAETRQSRCYPVRVRDVVYPSAADAAAALGVTVRTVYTMVGKGRTDTLGLGKSRHLLPKVEVCGKPVTLNGRTWRSAKQLAKHLGVTPDHVWGCFRRGREDLLIARLEGRSANGNARKVQVGIYSWSTTVEAAADLGVTIHQMRRLLKPENYEELLLLTMKRYAP